MNFLHGKVLPGIYVQRASEHSFFNFLKIENSKTNVDNYIKKIYRITSYVVNINITTTQVKKQNSKPFAMWSQPTLFPPKITF